MGFSSFFPFCCGGFTSCCHIHCAARLGHSRKLRERRPPPLRLSSPVANQRPGMRQPAPPAPVEEVPPGPPPPTPVSK
ncbi:hypothetical protein M0R45_023075 [Rubus argutus]|uniref:Uncharacterized protein n=1 Tax=Rubus argutus TaxID=59490 RepID=A0AAW1WP23_RUBAR